MGAWATFKLTSIPSAHFMTCAVYVREIVFFSENLLVMLEVLGSVSMKPSDFREFMGLIKPVDDEPKVSYCKPSG